MLPELSRDELHVLAGILWVALGAVAAVLIKRQWRGEP